METRSQASIVSDFHTYHTELLAKLIDVNRENSQEVTHSLEITPDNVSLSLCGQSGEVLLDSLFKRSFSPRKGYELCLVQTEQAIIVIRDALSFLRGEFPD